MSDVLNTTTLNSELFTELKTRSEFALYENSVVRSVTTVFDYPLGAGKTVSIPLWDAYSASTPAEGVKVDLAGVDTNSVEITLGEHFWNGALTDLLGDSTPENMIQSMATQAGMAIGESMDSQFIGLFNSMSGNVNVITQSVGSAGTPNTVKDILKAAAVIRNNKYAGPLYAIINPLQSYEIKSALTATTNYQNATTLASQALTQRYVGSIGGVTILESALVAIDSSDDSVGCVFAPSAFGFAQRGGVKVATERDERSRATILALTAVAKSGIIRPSLAVRLIGDTATA